MKIIKIGSSSLIKGNKVDIKFLEKLGKIIQKEEVVIVTSGAVALGRIKFGEWLEKQAASSLGQPYLMKKYQKAFSKRLVAQILISKKDIEDEVGRFNACNTFKTLLDCNIVPIVNENDAVAIEELKFGDNDTLSAYVAQMLQAQELIIVSDIDGLYNGAELIPIVSDISSVQHYIWDSKGMGTGGMQTKLVAGDICMKSNMKMRIVSKANFLKSGLSCGGTIFEKY